MAIEPLDLSDIRHSLAAPRQEIAPVKREVLLPAQLLQAMQTSGGFKAANINRLTMDWQAWILSADQELFSNLRILRGRSRSLAKNNQYAKKFLRQVEKNVIGHSGITFQAKVKKQRGDGLLKTVNEELERAWADWSKQSNCSVDGKLNLKALERFFIRNLATDGEVIIRKVPLSGNPYLFALQFIDPDQLDHTFFVNRLPNGNEIRMGVEVDEYGRPQAYHIWKRHPSEYTSSPHERVRVPAAEILHLFIPERVNQTRGIPWMTAAMIEMNMLGGYKEAEVTAARVAACKMGFFTSQLGDQYTGDPSVADPSVASNLTPGTGMQQMNVEPGMLESLPAGIDFKPWDPQHPNTNYAAFVKECLRGISSGLDVAYHVLGNDLEGINFSSIRSGNLDERDTWKMLQQWSIDFFCQPVYESWIPNAILAGGLELDAQNIQQYRGGAVWHARGWDWVDPLKDVQASVAEIQNGLSTITRELAERGLDFEEIMAERKRELDLIAELGIKIGTDTKGVADTASDDQQGQDDGSDGNKASKK